MKTRTQRKLFNLIAMLWALVFLYAVLTAKNYLDTHDARIIYLVLFCIGSLCVLIQKWDKKIKLKENKRREAFQIFYEKWDKENKGKWGEGFDTDLESRDKDFQSKWEKWLENRPDIPR